MYVTVSIPTCVKYQSIAVFMKDLENGSTDVAMFFVVPVIVKTRPFLENPSETGAGSIVFNKKNGCIRKRLPNDALNQNLNHNKIMNAL